MGVDLAFPIRQLERDYCDQHYSDQVFYDVGDQAICDLELYFLAYKGVRILGWTTTAIKTIKRSALDPTTALAYKHAAKEMLLVCLPSSLLPVFGLLLGKEFYKRTRNILVATANGLQFYQVSSYYSYLYPVIRDVTWNKSLIAVLSANGVSYLILTTFMGSLTFKWLCVSQYVNIMILLLSNKRICLQSPALQKAYTAAEEYISVSKIMRHLIPASLLPGFEQSSSDDADTLLTCMSSQLVLQVVLGFLIPCCLAYLKELQSRRAFLRARGMRWDPEFPLLRDLLMYLTSFCFPWILVYLTQGMEHS